MKSNLKNKQNNIDSAASKKKNYLYVSLIVVIWLLTYVLWDLVLFKHNLGWDEVSYLSVAKGIAKDFDFSSRSYTIMGLLKHGYPTNLINFPVFSIYLATFFKLFGFSLKVAYFSTWFAALGVCILIYFIFLTISENSHKLAFIVAMSYLYSPGIIKNCNTALMEQVGCLLLCLMVFFILRDYVKGKFDYFTVLKFSFSFLILWLYKSLFIGYFFGAFVFICLAYNSKIIGKKIETKIPLPVFLLLSYGLFVVLYYVLMKFVFLPVAPMMNFSPAQENSQIYADFLGGFFNNFSVNLLRNIDFFFKAILGPYIIYPTSIDDRTGPYVNYTADILTMTSYYFFVGIYFFVFLLMLVLTFALWKNLTSVEKIFISLVVGTIICFNLIFNFLFMTYIYNVWRYNVYSLPLYLCYLGIIAKNIFPYKRPFISDHPHVTKVLAFMFIVFIYVPLFLSSTIHFLRFEKGFHERAMINAQLIRSVIKNTDAKFVYMNDGTHTVFDDYPVRWIFKDATNEQLLQVNKILPSPIDFLFLRPSDWLFKNNQELISKGAPIIDGQYVLYGLNQDAHLVVYKLNKKV
ncbi:MAG: hypothetical protein HY094_08220 [Candidatus Melainabacteria bacterium]|nr:hypothetical protein [Candidatus Melainabacteria bacterium]